jgi:hypothetical protein
MSKKVIKDNGYIMISIPDRDIQSISRFIAHAFVQNQNHVTDLMHQIVTGDLSKQDEYVNQLARAIDLENWLIVLNGPEALELCDELADTIYDETLIHGPLQKKVEQEQPKLRLITICTGCHKSKIKGDPCENCSK